MKKTLIVLTSLSLQCFAVSPLDSLVVTAQDEAAAIKLTCINVPPSTTWCDSHYADYINDLTALQAPIPLTLNTGADGYQSPYSWSIYDICKYEPGRLINGQLCKI